MKGIVAWFAKNPVAANLLMIVAFVGGYVGYSQMERELFPTVPFTGATVNVTWQGASPQDVEEQIIVRVEEALADLNGMKRLTSTAREGNGWINVQGREDVDMDELVDEVKQRVDAINNFPPSAFRPTIRRWEGRNEYIGLVLYGDLDPREHKRLADFIRDEIAKLPGGELAEVQGVLSEEVSIEVSEDALRRYNLTLSDIATAIRSSSLNASGGRIESALGDISLSARQLADSQEQFEKIIIRQTTDGGTLRVSDVATVIDGFVDANVSPTYNRKPAAFIMVPETDVMDIDYYVKGIRDFVDRANDHNNQILPEAAQIAYLFDAAVVHEARMELISNSALLGALMVLIILVLFLRPVVAFWVTVGIITAFAGGIMLLPYLGVSWNILSTFAVLLVIGVVVDDAIIVGENIHSEVESGRREGIDAAIVGTQLVLKPVIFGVLTTIIAFLPWAFITGPMRLFTQQITFVVIAALIFSLIECMLILPAHLAHLKKHGPEGGGRFERFQRRIADSLLWFASNIYKPVLELAIRMRYATVTLFFSLFFIATQISGLGIVPFKFMPEIEGDTIAVTIELPEGTAFSRTLQVRDQLQNAVDRLTVEGERDYPQLENGLVIGDSMVATNSRVRAWIGLAPPEERPETLKLKDVTDRLRELTGPVQDAEEISFDFTDNDNDTGVRFALNHPDMDTLRAAADDVKAHLTTYGEVYDIADSLTSAADELQFKLKPGAEALGVTLADVTNQIRQAYFGELVDRLPRDGEDVEVRVRFPKDARRSIDSLENLRIRTRDGREIPLTLVAEYDFAPGINVIRRRDRTRSVSVFAEVKGDGGRNRIVEDMDENFWSDWQFRHPEVKREAAGGYEDQQQFNSELIILCLIAFGGMYILLAIAFGSYSQPVLLLTALPFAYCGAVFGHMFMGEPMAMFSLFGIAAAAGVVINDNLVLLDFVNRRRAQGVGAVQAVVEAGVSRFRPILLTSVTTFVGILPLIAERSVQAQFLKPMVISLGYAVAFALFVSLLLVPALYTVGVEIGRFFTWLYNGEPRRPIGETYSGEVLEDRDRKIPEVDDWDGVNAPAE